MLSLLLHPNSRLTRSQIGGMLLEEAVLSLIQACGYRPVSLAADDPTARAYPSGLRLNGRGTSHQIDAVADYILPQPLIYPIRLLVEAKCYTRDTVGIDVVRNSVGVEKDLQEFWLPSNDTHQVRPRYHYRSLIVTTSTFSKEAQEYAYAHDVSLLPLSRSKFFQPVLQSIQGCCHEICAFSDTDKVRRREQKTSRPPVLAEELNRVRQLVRDALSTKRNQYLIPDTGHMATRNGSDAVVDMSPLQWFVDETARLNYALFATVGANIPLFLVPAPGIQFASLQNKQKVRIYWDNKGWYLRNEGGQLLFSFDLPERLFNLFASEGQLTREGAVEMKFAYFTLIKALVQTENGVRMVEFELDQPWLEEIRRGFRNTQINQ